MTGSKFNYYYCIQNIISQWKLPKRHCKFHHSLKKSSFQISENYKEYHLNICYAKCITDTVGKLKICKYYLFQNQIMSHRMCFLSYNRQCTQNVFIACSCSSKDLLRLSAENMYSDK